MSGVGETCKGWLKCSLKMQDAWVSAATHWRDACEASAGACDWKSEGLPSPAEVRWHMHSASLQKFFTNKMHKKYCDCGA